MNACTHRFSFSSSPRPGRYCRVVIPDTSRRLATCRGARAGRRPTPPPLAHSCFRLSALALCCVVTPSRSRLLNFLFVSDIRPFQPSPLIGCCRNAALSWTSFASSHWVSLLGVPPRLAFLGWNSRAFCGTKALRALPEGGRASGDISRVELLVTFKNSCLLREHLKCPHIVRHATFLLRGLLV